ncbi:MAG: hypothetical protein ABS58_05610 [Mesorhizobium sp. SCN 65-20]|nr:MAG: hypothetical protein ABS58_05610 [Mesorhizobium sp. SCN 65-20]
MNLTALDRLASSRHDGLIPEMRELLGRLAAASGSGKVTELANHRGGTPIQSGPNPVGQAQFQGTNVLLLNRNRPVVTGNKD